MQQIETATPDPANGTIHAHHRPGSESPDWSAKAELVSRILKQGGKALIVGSIGDNFPVTYRSHPQLTFWDSDDHSTLTREVPANVRVIVFLRFLRHNLANRLISIGRARRLHLFPMLGTGEVKKLLSEIVHADPVPVALIETPPAETANADVSKLPDVRDVSIPDEAPAAEPAPKKQPKGFLRDFVAAHVQLTEGVPNIVEARRLKALAEAQGITSTLESVAQALYQHRRSLAGPAAAATTPAKVPRPAKTKPEKTAKPVLPLDERVVSDIMQARQMVVDMVQTFTASADVITEMLDKLSAEMFARRERLQRMKEQLAQEGMI